MSFSKINLQIIPLIAKKRKITLTELAQKMGITNTGLQKIIRENSTSIATLSKISDALEVPGYYFFMTENEIKILEDLTPEKFQELKKENERLKEEVESLKDKIIRIADRL